MAARQWILPSGQVFKEKASNRQFVARGVMVKEKVPAQASTARSWATIIGI